MINQHEKAVLQFSGGKDSLACLHLLRPHWEKITVLWVNTGAAYPETIEQMQAIRALVPHFEEVQTNQPEQIRTHGYPVDVLPTRNSLLGRYVHAGATPLMQCYLDCCYANIMQPMHEASLRLGTLIIRGQRNQEARKSPIRSGHIRDGMTYWFPLEDWSKEDVDEFLVEHQVSIPESYAFVDTSLDCWSCTAYLDENLGRMRHMQEKHPELWIYYRRRLDEIREATRGELAYLDAALEVQ